MAKRRPARKTCYLQPVGQGPIQLDCNGIGIVTTAQAGLCTNGRCRSAGTRRGGRHLVSPNSGSFTTPFSVRNGGSVGLLSTLDSPSHGSVGSEIASAQKGFLFEVSGRSAHLR